MKNEINQELLNVLIEIKQFIVDNMDRLPDSQEIRFKATKAINNAEVINNGFDSIISTL